MCKSNSNGYRKALPTFLNCPKGNAKRNNPKLPNHVQESCKNIVVQGPFYTIFYVLSSTWVFLSSQPLRERSIRRAILYWCFFGLYSPD